MASAMRVNFDPSVILHHRPFRETSLLLETFSREHGRLGVVARGARCSKRNQRALLQPGRPLLLSWSLRGELATLTGAEAGGDAWPLAGDALFAMFYLNELLLRLLGRQDAQPDLFDDYVTALRALAEGPLAPALRLFETKLLQATGYALELGLEADGVTPVQAGRRYAYTVERGARRLAEDESPPEGAVAVRGATLQGLRSGALADDAARGEAKVLLQTALSRYTGPRPLNTPALLRELRQVEQTSGV